MKRVAMFVTNPCTHDARVMKEAKSLANNGHEVRIFALSNAHFGEGIIQQENYIVHRLKFDNVFKRSQKILWGAFSTLINVIKKIFLVFWYLILILASIPMALMGSLLTPLFPQSGTALLNKAKQIIKKNAIPAPDKEKEDIEKKNKLQVLTAFFRKHRINIYFYLKRNFAFATRQKLQRIISTASYAVFYSIKVVYVSFIKTRAFLIKKINRLIYITLLPVHKITTYFFFCKEAARHAIEWQPHVAHAHDLNTLYAAKLVKNATQAKVVYDSHELWIHRNRVDRKATLEKQIDKVVEKILIKHVDAIITVCESIGDWLTNRYDNIPQPVILRNMPYKIPTSSGGKNIKERFGIKKDQIVMIYTGKLTTGRGINIGLKVLEETNNTHFLLLGYGKDEFVSDLKKKIKNKNIEHRVTFCDAVPHNEVSSFISGADIALVFIEPICLSYEFALPNKLFESIQANIPVMGSNLPEIKKLIEQYEIGECFNSASDLSQKLKYEVTPEKIDNWRKALAECRDVLCWDIEQNQLLELYETL